MGQEEPQFYFSFWRSNLISCETVARNNLQIAILPQVLAIEPHFVRKGLRDNLEIAILPQFYKRDDLKSRGCVSCRLVGTAPRLQERNRKEGEGKTCKRTRGEDVKMWGCGDEQMRGWEDVKMSRCEDEQMWRWEDVKKSRCEDVRTWRWDRCEDEKMWRCEDVKMRRCEDEKMWRWEDVKMRGCEDEKMWRCEDVKMWGCEDEKMWRWEDVRMRRCEDGKMWRWEDVKMRRCEDEKMWGWEDVKMRRCFFTDGHYWKNPELRRSREKCNWIQQTHTRITSAQTFLSQWRLWSHNQHVFHALKIDKHQQLRWSQQFRWYYDSLFTLCLCVFLSYHIFSRRA